MYNPPDFEGLFKSVLNPNWLKAIDIMNKPDEKSDEVIQHTKMDEIIYNEKRKEAEENDSTIKEIEQLGEEKLKSFPALTKDVFNSFYNIKPEFKPDGQISIAGQKFNKMIMKKTLENDEYKVLKQLTEGCDIESMEAAKEFVANIYQNLDELLKDASGEGKTLDVIENKMNQAMSQQQELKECIDKARELSDKGMQQQAQAMIERAGKIAKDLEKKNGQIDHLMKIVDMNTAKNKDNIDKKISVAIKKAADKTEEIKDILDAWGDGDPKYMKTEVKKEIIEKIRNNKRFLEMSKLVGRYKRLARGKIKDSFTYGIGERFDVELGNDLNRTVSSEFALLANPLTTTVFMKKYAAKQLKQFKKREKTAKGNGNIVFCGDESGSIGGGKDFWCKAMACSLLDVSLSNNKNFACIHFASKGQYEIDEINKENFDIVRVMKMAEMFLGGGTDFETPLEEARKLLETEKYKYTDLVFVTDGECDVSDEFLKTFLEAKSRIKFNVIGVLLDKGEGSVSDVSLRKFCDIIYKSSEFDEDDIAEKILAKVA